MDSQGKREIPTIGRDGWSLKYTLDASMSIRLRTYSRSVQSFIFLSLKGIQLMVRVLQSYDERLGVHTTQTSRLVREAFEAAKAECGHLLPESIAPDRAAGNTESRRDDLSQTENRSVDQKDIGLQGPDFSAWSVGWSELGRDIKKPGVAPNRRIFKVRPFRGAL